MQRALVPLTHGLAGLGIAYGLVLAALAAALLRNGAGGRRVAAAPLLALPATLVLGLIVSALLARFERHPFLKLAAGAALYVLLGWLWGECWARRGLPRASQLRRGAALADAPARGRGSAALTLAGLPVQAADETKHFKLIGTTGTGKSTAIIELLEGALKRGDRAVIADPEGGYLARFYDSKRGDVILSPFDADAHRWRLLGEIQQDHDTEQLARSLIPDNGDPDPVWPGYARTLFRAIVQASLQAGVREDREVYRLLTRASDAELRTLLAGSIATPFLGVEKMFGSARSVMNAALDPLEYCICQQAAPLSVRRWVQQRGSGVLFLPYQASEIAALRGLISAWLRLAIFEAMSQPEGDQRLWFVIDELDALGEIDGLKDALARLRKFGGRCVLGFQSIAQVSGTYGQAAAATIVENCGNTLILRCSASEQGGTSEFAARLIGLREVLHTSHSATYGAHGRRVSRNASELLRTEPAVMAAQIERLPDLCGYLKSAGDPDWRRVRLQAHAPVPHRERRPAVRTSWQALMATPSERTPIAD